jgi:hypothetical protein
MSKAFNRVQTLLNQTSADASDKEVYIVVLSSIDRLNDDEVTTIRQRAGRTDAVDGGGNAVYTDDNPALGNVILDTRIARFQINWGSVLPKKYQRFRVSCYFMSNDIIKPNQLLPPNDNRNNFELVGGQEIYNTSNGVFYDNYNGKFLKIMTNLYSSNQFDASRDGRSTLLSIANRYSTQDISATGFATTYQFETAHPYLFQPIIEYPAQDLFEVRLCGTDNQLIVPEALLITDYLIQTTDNGFGTDNTDVIRLPIMSDWYLVLGFMPCV